MSFTGFMFRQLAGKGDAKLFPFTVPSQIHIRALGLNCGMYEIGLPKPGEKQEGAASMTKSLMRDYLGKDKYPPAYIMTAYYDFLKEKAEPMYEFLKSKGVDAEWKCYGSEETKYMQHVCHVNMNLEEAKQINNDECAFFRKHMN